MSGLLAALTGARPLLLDGGLGSMLIARGLGGGEAPERWVLERGEQVAAVHRAYVEAGADAVQTATFGAHPARLARAGLEGRAGEVARAAVALARAAGAPFVIGDLGPSGEYLPPVGRADAGELALGFERLAAALAAAGVDALHVETMSDRREAALALAAALRAAPGVPVLVSLTFERRPRGFFTVMGDPLVASLAELAAAGAAAVGANCTLASSDMLELARAARAALATPLVVQPNAGRPILEAGVTRYAQAPEAFAADLAAIAALGVEAVGGCCGTDPDFIAALRRRLRAPAGGPR
ncbi:MAG: methionine synthase cobalamin-binding domain protein [Acidobacteria bacterium]|nr:methionine synthase cobalamin-binding domain protein [Acidobacteriota bacterium]